MILPGEPLEQGLFALLVVGAIFNDVSALKNA